MKEKTLATPTQYRQRFNNTLTRAEIVKRVCEKGVSKEEATNVLEAAFDIIKAALERGEKVRIMNFGIFSVRAKNPRRGHNSKGFRSISFNVKGAKGL